MKKIIHQSKLILEKSYILATFLTLIFPLLTPSLTAQTNYAHIKKITIEGTKHTKDYVLLRELDFKQGDTIPLAILAARIQRNEQLLMNTGLFTFAKITYSNWEGETNRVSLLITVGENWYIYPFPIFELADRNFNVWWETYKRSLRRVNFGMRFYHINLTGRQDVLKLVGQWGFTQKYEIDYALPGINKKRTLGLVTNFLYARNKEIAYTTFENKLQFHRDPKHILLQRFRGSGGLTYRPKLNEYQSFILTFHQNRIHESVLSELNPDFLLQRLDQQYFSLNYNFKLDLRDIKPYPLSGFLISASVQKDGLGLLKDRNALTLSGLLKQYFSFSPKWSIEFIAKGQTNFIRKKQPYFNSIALGYELDYIRGYEFYVMDGLDYLYAKTSLHFELFQWAFSFGKLMPLKPFKQMPIKAYLAINNDLGYVNNPYYKTTNSLSNELLWGGGVGIDLIIYNDKVFQFEYSFNRLGERGFFLHWELNF